MGKKYSVLKDDILEANSIFNDDIFYKATGLRLNFMLIGRIHYYRNQLNNIQVDQIIPLSPPKVLGLIKPSRLKLAIKIGKNIKSLSKYKTPTEDEDNLCCICLERNIDVLLICGHGYCERDILDWQHREQHCPMCRKTLHNDQMYSSLEYFQDDGEIKQNIEELLKLISR